MVFAVADEDGPVGIDKYAVRARQPAVERIPVQAVAAFASAGDHFDGLFAGVDAADAVTFGVREIDVAIRRNADSLWPGQCRFLCGTTVSSEPAFSRPGDAMDRACLQVELVNRVPFTQREPCVPVPVKVDRARTVKRRGGELRAVRRGEFLSRARERGNDPGFHVHLADAAVADVTDAKVPVPVKLDAVRLS